MLTAIHRAGHLHGYPASTLTGNGTVFTTRFAGGGTGARNGLELELPRLGITQNNSRPNHPTTCGKVCEYRSRCRSDSVLTPAKV